MKQWFTGMQKELYVLGPHLPSGYGMETQNGEEGKNYDIETFLGEMLVQHGKNSVFYVGFFPSFCIPIKYISSQISFGTVFYPPVSEYVDELIEALIEKKAPFVSDSCFVYNIYNILCLFYQVFAHASPFVKIPEQLIEKVKSSGLGKLTAWSPQQLILNHPVLYYYFFKYLSWLNTYNKILLLQATGWFITHGGFNGVTESLGSGVPL
jgi:hypothetical protein